MDWFHYRDGELLCEEVRVSSLVETTGTPAYLYSARTLSHHVESLVSAFAELEPLLCFSVKSCSNVHILRLLARMGMGMDVVSGGELHRARLASVDPSRIVYAGVGKTQVEMEEALHAGIGLFNVESEEELGVLAALGRARGQTPRAALRINPDVVDPATPLPTATGSKETKFGVDLERAAEIFDRHRGSTGIRLDGLHVHIGSPIPSPASLQRALSRVLDLVTELRQAGHPIGVLDMGGGLPADYETGASIDHAGFARAVVPLLRGRGLEIILEPGRTIAANAGILVSRVLYTKTGGSRHFAVVDTGMHHLLRPSLYGAFHFVWPVRVDERHVPPRRARDLDLAGLESTDVVGPICETADVLAKGRLLPPVRRGDLLAIFTAGAYGMSMASNYNGVPRPPEVLVQGDRATLIRRRETYQDLVGPEEVEDSLALTRPAGLANGNGS